MPTLNWIGKEKVVNHHLEVLFYTLERKYGFSGECSANKAKGDHLANPASAAKVKQGEYFERLDKIGRYKYFMTYQHQGVEGAVAVNKLVELMKRM